MGGPDEETIERALIEAEEAIRRVLERALGSRASDIEITLSVYYDDEGVARLRVDVSASRRGVRELEDIIDAAIQAGVARFEEATGLRGRRRRRGTGEESSDNHP